MRASKSFFAAALFGLLVLIAGMITTASAQQRTHILRMGQYNKASEVVVTGTIQSIQTEDGTSSLPRGTYLTLLSPPLTLNVQMGLFGAASIPFKAGDSVSVTGSLMTVNGAQILLARLVQSSTHSITVRSKHGFIVRPQPVGQTSGGLQ
jgi:hypothetical protein